MSDSGTTLADWRAWHAACALGLTPEGSRGVLEGFLGRRFGGMVRRMGSGGLSHRVPGDAACASLFETWCCLHRRREGKRYKDWLMARGDGSLGAVESGVMLLLRKVVLEWVRMEFPRGMGLSLEAELGAGGVTLEELLPEGTVAAEVRFEEEGWVRERVPGWVAAMTRAERAAVAARREGRSFVDAGVLRAAGVGKTALHKHFRGWVTERAAEVRSRFGEMPAAEGTALVLRILELCGNEIFLNFSEEGVAAAGCRVMEDPDD